MNYINEIKKLSINEGGSFWVFDPDRRMHCPWDFKQEDLDKMKEAGVQWLIEMCNYGQSNIIDPWFRFSNMIRNHLGTDPDMLYWSLERGGYPQKMKDEFWDAFVWFVESVYITPRYVNRQEVLWQDIRKDYGKAKRFFPKSEDVQIYVELLIHHMASVIGIKLGNIAGD